MNGEQDQQIGSSCGPQNGPREELFLVKLLNGPMVVVTKDGNVVQWGVECPEAIGLDSNSLNSNNHFVEQVFEVNGSETLQTDAASYDTTSCSNSKLGFLNTNEQASQESLDVLKSYTDSNILQVPSSVVTTKAFNTHSNTLSSQLIDANTLCGSNVGNISFIGQNEESEQRTEKVINYCVTLEKGLSCTSGDNNITWNNLSLPENILLIVHPIVKKTDQVHPFPEHSFYFPIIKKEETQVSLFETVASIQGDGNFSIRPQYAENIMNISQASTAQDLSLANNYEQIDFVGNKSQSVLLEPTALQFQNAVKPKPKPPRKPAAKRKAKSQRQKVEQVVSNVEVEKIRPQPPPPLMPIPIEVKPPKPAIVVTEDIAPMPWARRIPGQMVVCSHCGVCSEDLHFCIRCKVRFRLNAKFFKDAKYVPKPEDVEKKTDGPETQPKKLVTKKLKATPTRKGKQQNIVSIVLSSDEDEPKSKVQKCDLQSDESSTATTTNGLHHLLMQRIVDLNTSNDQTSVVNNIQAAVSKESLQCSNVNSTLSPNKIIQIKTTEIMPLGTIIKDPMTSLGPPLDPQPSSQVSKSESEIKLLSYQGLTITHSDILCLADEQFLNDSILEFGLRYIEHEILSPEDRSRTHMFSTFFYNRLTTKPRKRSTIEDDPNLPNSEKRHNRVKRWTKNVDIFEKDFLILPINEHLHWFLAIICYPGLLGVHDMITGEPIINYTKRRKQVVKPKPLIKTEANSQLEAALNNNIDKSEKQSQEKLESNEKEEESVVEKQGGIKRPCILILDSLAGESRTRVFATLREYLKVEYKTRKGEDREFTKLSMPGETIVVPQQPNHCDCGIYTLHYVQDFFQSPLFSFEMPINDGNMVFHENLNTHQREEIYKVIKALINNTNPELLKLVPNLEFNRAPPPPPPTQKIVLTKTQIKHQIDSVPKVLVKKVADEEEDMGVDVEFSSQSEKDLSIISNESSLQPSTVKFMRASPSDSDHDHDYASVPAESKQENDKGSE